MVAISVRSNVKQMSKRLKGIQRKQIPFATSLAINDTAFAVRKRIVERTYPRSFQVRNRRFPGQVFRVKKATKRRLIGSVYDRLGRASLALHAKGGTKRPRGGSLAVPSENIKRTASGKVGKARRPRNVIQSGKAFKGKIRKDRPAIFQRTGSKGRKLKLLYTLEPSARLRARFPFYRDAANTARRSFPNNYRRAMRRALKTAR